MSAPRRHRGAATAGANGQSVLTADDLADIDDARRQDWRDEDKEWRQPRRDDETD